MKFRWSSNAAAHLTRLSPEDQQRIAAKMRFFAESSSPMLYAKKLTGRELYRFRIGTLRVIFQRRADELYILAIAKRDDVYRDL